MSIIYSNDLLCIIFLLKRSVKYFSSIYLLHNKVCLCGGTNQRLSLEVSFRDILRMIYQIDLIWQHQFSQTEEAPSKILSTGHWTFKDFVSSSLSFHFHLLNTLISNCFQNIRFLSQRNISQTLYSVNFIKNSSFVGLNL